MKTFFVTIANGINQLNEWVGQTASWLTSILVVLVCFDVVTRYLFSNTSAWIMELEWHLFAMIFLLGAAYAFKHNRHVRVDLFYDRFSEKDKAWVNLLGAIIFLLPWSALLAYYAYDYAMISYLIGEGSPDPGGLPARYVIKFMVPVGLSLLFLQGFANLIESILVLNHSDTKNKDS